MFFYDCGILGVVVFLFWIDVIVGLIFRFLKVDVLFDWFRFFLSINLVVCNIVLLLVVLKWMMKLVRIFLFLK